MKFVKSLLRSVIGSGTQDSESYNVDNTGVEIVVTRKLSQTRERHTEKGKEEWT